MSQNSEALESANVGGCGKLSLGIAVFLLVVVALYVTQPDYDPWTQLMGELALEPGGA
ncbi:MAG: hypothetical protein LBD68_07620 [Zoogloeaceae bacterium]|jgi:hypothetical protein|nr:hypothetical protein [Zoogloeaceae bacterium]